VQPSFFCPFRQGWQRLHKPKRKIAPTWGAIILPVAGMESQTALQIHSRKMPPSMADSRPLRVFMMSGISLVSNSAASPRGVLHEDTFDPAAMLEANRGQQARRGKTESFVKPNGGTVRTIPDDRSSAGSRARRFLRSGAQAIISLCPGPWHLLEDRPSPQE
jgi:hypothetical protein